MPNLILSYTKNSKKTTRLHMQKTARGYIVLAYLSTLVTFAGKLAPRVRSQIKVDTFKEYRASRLYLNNPSPARGNGCGQGDYLLVSGNQE